ncbi:MAG: sulfite exporter TauE/SafE family protein [Sulfitobacter sp.]|nr:sulfite exporter TauE/SafE family protein [Sulfitobacter sp.]
MSSLIPFLDPIFIALAFGIALCAGFVKGVVGFAMPLVLISGLTLFLSPDLALAGLILPTLLSNVIQSLRQGWRAAVRSIKAFRIFLVSGAVTLIIAAQFVPQVPEEVLQLALGVPLVGFAVLQLAGIRMHLARRRAGVEAAAGGVAGVMGGMSGIWGPPTVAYLTALDTPKYDQMRVQGVIYGLGSVLLFGAHIGSGVLNWETAPFSAFLILPALAGMWLGGLVIDRIDQESFRRATLLVVLVAGANLVRRGLF